MDLNPMTTPNSVMTDCLNGTIITYDGNEWNLQNDLGNYTTDNQQLENYFVPIGMKAYGDIIYIISYNDSTKDCQIGSYPSPSYEGNYGDLVNKYKPLKNYSIDNGKTYGDFTAKLNFSLDHPIDIEIQPSYDGSVNLLLNDDYNEPLIINSGFSVRENGKYEIVKRNQYEQTNKYLSTKLQSQIKLIRTVDRIPKIVFDDILYTGQLKGGNYSFYIRFADSDYNKTDVVCESGVISIFKGNYNSINSVSGAFQSELTDKAIKLRIDNIDPTFSNLYVYYTREYCDNLGFKLTECRMISNAYNIPLQENTNPNDSRSLNIIINGVEATEEISVEELNIQYIPITKAKTQAQQQNMLFLANVGNSKNNYEELQKLAYKVNVKLVQGNDSIGWVNNNYEDLSKETTGEYYNPKNIYYKLGYWPEEYYRFGIVFIKEDDTLTPVFNIFGRNLKNNKKSTSSVIGDNLLAFEKHPVYTDKTWGELAIEAEDGIIATGNEFINKWGIFKNPPINSYSEIQDYTTQTINPWYYQFTFGAKNLLKQYGIKGYFYVRQKRVPTILCQGLCIGIDSKSHTPILYDNEFANNYNSIYKDYNNNPSDRARFINGLPLFEQDRQKGNNNDTPWCPVGGENYATEGKKWAYFAESFLAVYNQNYIASNNPSKKPDRKIANWYTVLVNDGFPELTTEGGTNDDTDEPNDIETNPEFTALGDHIIRTNAKSNSALLSLDPCIIPTLQSQLNGINRKIKLVGKFNLQIETKNAKNWTGNKKVGNIRVGKYATRKIILNKISEKIPDFQECNENKIIYVNDSTPSKVITTKDSNKKEKNVIFSTRAGSQYDVSQFSIFSTGFDTIRGKFSDKNWSDFNVKKKRFGSQYRYMIRGEFCPILGVDDIDNQLIDNGLYNIYTDNYDPNDFSCIRRWFEARSIDDSEYYAITDRIDVNDDLLSVNAYRGDCFSSTVTMRLNRNFLDPTVPISDDIVNSLSWYDNFDGIKNTTQDKYNAINRADINSVSLGMWVQYKCLSNYNLGLRSENTFYTDEYALVGNPRSFYPLSGISTKSGTKISESYLQNSGYNTILSEKRNNQYKETPYNKTEYSNRIIFSNVYVKDSFENGYRTFQGASYRDIDTQYGSIIKIIPWGVNLFVVFEHGCGILAVNPKALMQTTTEATIHIYGYGVLNNQIDAVVSQDFGSFWKDSVIKTPIGIYGVDTYAKKIWRYKDKGGFETISDMKIQRFLNDNINLKEGDNQEHTGLINVKTHYNMYKGDIMFTFYNGNTSWNLCYNERMGCWVTRYSWVPIESANVNNIFYSVDLDNVRKQLNNPGDYPVNIYMHGRSGLNVDNINPTKWYGKQYPFEYEFVVKESVGVHKIFENLIIVSNNVQPVDIDFEIIGDTYLFNKSRIYSNGLSGESNIYGDNLNDTYNKDQLYNNPACFKNVYIKYDKVLNQFDLVLNQKCKNLETYGRRLGNIQYKEDSWYVTIDPIIYDQRIKDPNFVIEDKDQKWISTRLRDKWVKIRIKYSGEDLAIITGIQTIYNISYS